MDELQVGFHPPAALQRPHKARLCVILYLNIMPGHFSFLCRATYPLASVSGAFDGDEASVGLSSIVDVEAETLRHPVTSVTGLHTLSLGKRFNPWF